jgi:RNA polymerase sigma-70 factor (ECF subfamily)
MTDENVVRTAQQGAVAAFERIYRSHSRKVYTLCLRMAGDRSEAEDLTQDVFLQLFPKINTLRGEAAFSTWLHRMSVHIVLLRLRKKTRADKSLDTITNLEQASSAAGNSKSQVPKARTRLRELLQRRVGNGVLHRDTSDRRSDAISGLKYIFDCVTA